MSIYQIEQAKELKKYCSKIGREGMGAEVVALAKQIIENQNDYVAAMGFAGRIRAITTGAVCDSYFGEKVHLGFGDMYWQAKRFNNFNK